MSDLVLRLARPGEDARIADFINQNFDMRLPLINRADFYQFYYAHTPGAAPQFALAEQDGEILCAAGYILANQSETPDIWVSVWVAAKGHNGVGLELMDALSGLLNARVVACNNIRANTCVLYHFLGWQAERLPHYYRLGCALQRLHVPQSSQRFYLYPRHPIECRLPYLLPYLCPPIVKVKLIHSYYTT